MAIANLCIFIVLVLEQLKNVAFKKFDSDKNFVEDASVCALFYIY